VTAKVTQQVAVGEVDQPMPPPEADQTPAHGIPRPPIQVRATDLNAGDKTCDGLVTSVHPTRNGLVSITVQQVGPRVSYLSTYVVKPDTLFTVTQ